MECDALTDALGCRLRLSNFGSSYETISDMSPASCEIGCENTSLAPTQTPTGTFFLQNYR